MQSMSEHLWYSCAQTHSFMFALKNKAILNWKENEVSNDYQHQAGLDFAAVSILARNFRRNYPTDDLNQS